jgi:hypothetical protein
MKIDLSKDLGKALLWNFCYSTHIGVDFIFMQLHEELEIIRLK